MDQATAKTGTDRAMLAMPSGSDVLTPDPAIIDPAEHNIVFTSLVTSDKDIVGLVAYSIYKQNKYDWLHAFSRLQGRMPDEAEAQSYLFGESTPRRLATYRHLAEAVLNGRGPHIEGGAASPMVAVSGAARSDSKRAKTGFQMSPRTIVGLCIALAVLLVLFWLMRNGAPMPPPAPK